MRKWMKIWLVTCCASAGSIAAMASDAAGQGASESTAPAAARTVWRQHRNAILESQPRMAHDPSSVLVGFAAGVTAEERDLVLKPVGAQIVREYTLVEGLVQVSICEMTVEQAIVQIGAAGDLFGGLVEYAVPDQVVHAVVTPNDTHFTKLWGMNNTGQLIRTNDTGTANADIDAPAAWNVFTGNPNTVVAIIDTGIYRKHEDLEANEWLTPGEIAGNGVDDEGDGYIDDWKGWDFYSNDPTSGDDHGHGTHVSGTIGAIGNNGKGVTGVNWTCKVAALKFLNSGGSGYTSDAIEALQYAVAHGIKISNNSWGGGGYDTAMYNAINAARTAGHLFVAAAGNNGTNNDSSPFYPCSYNLDNIISVAAIDNDNNKASWSNYGATSVDLAAPGVNIYSLSNISKTSYVWMSGTSMACPHVTGVAALVWGKNPTWTYSQVRSRIFTTVKPISSMSGKCATGGCLNANNAIQ